MAINAISIPAQSMNLSDVVIDTNLDLGAYELLAAKVKASEILADYIDELVVSAGLTLGLASGGIISVANSLDCSGALSGNAFAGFMQRKYTGNSGSEIFAVFIPPGGYASISSVTPTASGIRIRIPDTGIPAANLKLTAIMKSSSDTYCANCKIYKNGGDLSNVASTTGTDTVLQECAFASTVAVAAGDYLDFYIYNANASYSAKLYAIKVIGDVTMAGGLIGEQGILLGGPA